MTELNHKRLKTDLEAASMEDVFSQNAAPGLKLRFAEPSKDIPQLVELLHLSFAELGPDPRFKAAAQSIIDDTYSSPGRFTEVYLAHESGTSAFFVFEDEKTGNLGGCIGMQRANPYEARLVRLVVAPSHRRRGLGGKLTRCVLGYSLLRGYDSVILDTIAESGRGLYLSEGFESLGRSFMWKRLTSTRAKVSKVAVIGGTHGNELIGAHLVTHVFPAQPLGQEHVQVELVLANPKALKQGMRYVEEDLNRCFALDDLLNKVGGNYERTRAREINHQLGGKREIRGSIREWKKQAPAHACEYMIDLHSSTSNMGISLITLANNPLTMRLAASLELFLCQSPLKFHLVVDSKCKPEEYNNMDATTPSGMCLEVGPLAHGTLNSPVLYEWTKKSVEHLIECISLHNQDKEFAQGRQVLDAVEPLKPVYFPQKEGRMGISARLHESFLGKDFMPLKRGDPVFVDLETNVVIPFEDEENYSPYPGWVEEELCAYFIGEAAYFESGVAFWLARRKKVFAY